MPGRATSALTRFRDAFVRGSGLALATLTVLSLSSRADSPSLPTSAPTPSPATTHRLGDAWSDLRNPVTRTFHGQRLELWSLKPLASVRPPAVSESGRPLQHPVDRFLQARLVAENVTPAPAADRRTLARRLWFDLVGLPPTAEEVDDFVQDPTPDAYARRVERLLASPRYGEHQARLWLDVLRYSDSNGFDWDEFRPQAWRFRDYLVRALNADKPFDRLVRELLAGDELIDDAPRDADEQDRLIATGYLRLGPQDNSAPLFNEQARARAEWLADLTETTGSAFLGLTFACCRCHDHKFDPLLQEDHYRLRAFFEPIQRADALALDLREEQAAVRAQHAEIQRATEPLRTARDTLLNEARAKIRQQRLAALAADDRAFFDRGQPATNAPAADRERFAALEKKLGVSDDDARQAFAPDVRKRHEELTRSLAALESRKRPFTLGLLATDTTNQVPVTRVLSQGDPKAERDPVVPGFLSALDPNPAEIRRGANPATTGRRLTLADWITSPSNPLTARVLVNRAWQAFFGRGLVTTPNDFGLAGATPSHPELLDWLAADVIAHGWSLKNLHRTLVTSAAYQRASWMPSGKPELSPNADPGLYARQTPRRLTAEQVRDALLAVSGLLQERGGGPPVWPELPAEVLQANPAFLDDNAEKTKGWYPSGEEQRSVRSLFLVQKRTVRVPFLETFDLPENTVSCPQRNVSIVAPQALSLLNGPEALAAAEALAREAQREAGGAPTEVIRAVYRRALQRPPSPREAAASAAFLARASLPEFCRALLNVNEFVYVD